MLKEIFQKILDTSKRKFIESVDVTFIFTGTPIKSAIKLPHQKKFKGKIMIFTKQNIPNISCVSEVSSDKKSKKLMIKKYTHFGITDDCVNLASKIVPVLGPRNKMPSEKTANIFKDVNQVLTNLKENTIFASKASGKLQLMHCSIGDISMESNQLIENFYALKDHLGSLIKSKFEKVYISSTMGSSYSIKKLI